MGTNRIAPIAGSGSSRSLRRLDGLRPASHTHNTRAYNSTLLERPLTTGEVRANVS